MVPQDLVVHKAESPERDRATRLPAFILAIDDRDLRV